MIEPAFRMLLASDATVTQFVGDRINHVVLPQNERRPSIVLKRVSTIYARTFGGNSPWTKGRMQIDCFAGDYETAKKLTKAVRMVIDQFADDLPASDPRHAVAVTIREATGISTKYIEVEDERDVESAPLAGQATPLFGVTVDARFLFEE